MFCKRLNKALYGFQGRGFFLFAWVAKYCVSLGCCLIGLLSILFMMPKKELRLWNYYRADKILLWVIVTFLAIANCFAGPPFITDDPYPVEYKHWEIYLFSEIDRTHDNLEIEIPALELNYGLMKRLEASAVFPLVFNKPKEEEPNAFGNGDLELGLKYAFNKETKYFPQIAINPTYMIPLGDSDRGLGNGRAWWQLPIWIGKTWNKLNIYGGGGYAVNSAQGERNFLFSGIATEYDVTDKFMLGGEIFSQGADAADSKSFILVNLGGSYNFTKKVTLLFSIGNSLKGENHFVSYLALRFHL